MALARLIILNYQPDVRAGREDVLAILFDMNELFETYVFRQVRRAAAKCGRDDITVSGQRSKRFWRSPHSSRGIRPDIVVTWGDGGPACSAILDTKWKTPKARHPDDVDLKQMYAYNLQFGAQRSYLLYPHTTGDTNVDGHFVPTSVLGDLDHSCGMWFVELFDGGRLRSDFGSAVLERLLAVH
jgi:5-methylcytosine-specific restriction enzyme subunit McrC